MQVQATDVITPEDAGTLHGLFLERVRRSPDKIAYRYFSSDITPASGHESSLKLGSQQDGWRDITWRAMYAEVARWQAALLGEHLAVGDRVAIMLRNCPQWVMFEQAAMSLGLVVVPLYTVDRPDNVAFIINDAQVRVLLFETGEQWQALRAVQGQLGCVQRLVSLDRITTTDEEGGCDTLLRSSRLREQSPAAPPAPDGSTAPCRDGYCTYREPERFFSYRRDGVTGRMGTFIWIAR